MYARVCKAMPRCTSERDCVCAGTWISWLRPRLLTFPDRHRSPLPVLFPVSIATLPLYMPPPLYSLLLLLLQLLLLLLFLILLLLTLLLLPLLPPLPPLFLFILFILAVFLLFRFLSLLLNSPLRIPPPLTSFIYIKFFFLSSSLLVHLLLFLYPLLLSLPPLYLFHPSPLSPFHPLSTTLLLPPLFSISSFSIFVPTSSFP